jgi:alkaline phosphatase D
MSNIFLPRRRFLATSVAASGLGLSTILAHAQAPALVTSDRTPPGFPSGVQSGDVLADRGVVWARSDRPARMWVEWSTAPSFTQSRRVRGPHALEATDHSARIDLTGLPAGQDIFYRVRWEDLAAGGLSEPMTGHCRTAPRRTGLSASAGPATPLASGWGSMNWHRCWRSPRIRRPQLGRCHRSFAALTQGRQASERS